MKILLVEPNIEGYALMPSMALAVLKSFINNKTKHRAEIADFLFHKKEWREYLFHKIKKFNPDIIGFSIMSFNYSQALKMAGFIKKNFNMKIIFGGVHAILMPEQTLKNKEVDMVCACEGEYVLKELMDKKLNCKNVKGIWYKGSKEEIIINKEKFLPLLTNQYWAQEAAHITALIAAIMQ